MPGLNYETADTLVYDPVPANRTATRAALYTLGFRSIDTVATLQDFAIAIHSRPPDLAVCEAQGADAELCQVIQSLRQGMGGYNPFIIIIVTAWGKSDTLVRRVLDSGADDLLLRPFSTNLLGTRIVTHIERRKSFVVTHDYVGPDRRTDPSRSSKVELFEPPNSLRMKTRNRITSDQAVTRFDTELRAAKDLLHSQKLRRDVFQVGVLWRLLQDGKPDVDGYAEDLSKLTRVVQEISRRCGDKQPQDAGKWCESVLAAVEGIERGTDREASLQLLGNAAMNLWQTLVPEKPLEDHKKELDETVTVIRARQVQAKAAAEAAAQAAAAPSTPVAAAG